MECPKSVKVGPLTYAIKCGDDEWYRSNGQSAAQCDNTLQVITMHAGMHADKTACSFAHEVAHAVVCAGCWDNQTNSYNEEQVADIASYGMVQVWQDNPEVFGWWINLIKGV